MFDERLILRNQNVIGQCIVKHSIPHKFIGAVKQFGRVGQNFDNYCRIQNNIAVFVLKFGFAADYHEVWIGKHSFFRLTDFPETAAFRFRVLRQNAAVFPF